MGDALVKLGRAVSGGEPSRRKAPLPTPSDVVYELPNVDGTGKLCGNCWMFCRDKSCLLVDGKIVESQVCGYHAFGVPQAKWKELGQTLVDQKQAGLISAPPEGTMCGNCRFFSGGFCLATQTEDEESPKVDKLGCCARWRGG